MNQTLTRPQRRERAILIGVALNSKREDVEASLDELASLASTAGFDAVAKVTQQRESIHPATFIGKGKVEEVAALCVELNADVLLFDHELSPAQARNLEQMTNRRVIDRTELILAIFSKRAQTKQAKMQVELAQLRYQLPRLRHLWSHLERQPGAPGVRGGMGEQQIEIDRRRVMARIADLERKLKKVQKRTDLHIHGREGMFTVALVGYTNVGKSTLMNALAKAGVFVEDRLFATLDATTRVVRLGHGQRVLLTDTVGFIRSLPVHLVASFHATLSEVRTAHLLLHVVDIAHPQADEQIQTVQKTLLDIGAADKPTLTVLNKSDLLPEGTSSDGLLQRYPNSVLVSALTGDGLEELKRLIETEYIRQRQVEVELKAPVSAGEVFGFAYQNGAVLFEHYEDQTVHLRLLMEHASANRLIKLAEEWGDSIVVTTKPAGKPNARDEH